MSGVPVLVPSLLPESLLQTKRFPEASIPTISRFAVFGGEEKSSMQGSMERIRQENTHNGVCR